MSSPMLSIIAVRAPYFPATASAVATGPPPSVVDDTTCCTSRPVG